MNKTKRGRPVGGKNIITLADGVYSTSGGTGVSNNKKFLDDMHNGPKYDRAIMDIGSIAPDPKILNVAIDEYWANLKLDQPGIDNDPGIDVPLHARGLTSEWNFQKTKKRMPWYDKVTWVLTAVNVGILISLVIKNV